jgi:DNA-binding transcriptional MerR regulator
VNSWYPSTTTLSKASRRVGDVARELGEPVSVIRYWSDWFKVPVSRVGGQRRFPQKAVDRLRLVKFLLRNERYSIEGAKQHVERLVSCDW